MLIHLPGHGALLNEIQSFPTLEDIRGAICQMQCPERNKETFDDHPLFVSPCVFYQLLILLCKNVTIK